jgi:hypothetical protein
MLPRGRDSRVLTGARLAVNREYDFTAPLVVDEQVHLRTEFSGLRCLQFADDRAGAGRQFNLFTFWVLRTEAAIITSANDQIQDAHRRSRAVVQTDTDFTSLADAAGQNFNVSFGFDGSTRRRREIPTAPNH